MNNAVPCPTSRWSCNGSSCGGCLKRMSFAALCHYAVLLKWSAATLTSYDNIASNFSIQIARRKVMTASDSFAFEREDDRRVAGGGWTEPGNRPRRSVSLGASNSVSYGGRSVGNAMNTDTRVSCALCKIPDETKVTGALSTKEHVTAHQNCLVTARNTFSFKCLRRLGGVKSSLSVPWPRGVSGTSLPTVSYRFRGDTVLSVRFPLEGFIGQELLPAVRGKQGVKIARKSMAVEWCRTVADV